MEVQSKNTISSEIILKELQSPFTSDIGKGFSGSIKNMRLTLKENDGNNATRSRAVKILPLKEQKRVIEEAKREIKVFETLPSHPNILHFHGSCIDDNNAFIVLEKADTDALSILKRQTPNRKDIEEQPSELWLGICIDIAKAMEHLHSHGFYHRDLHMQNWLFFLNDTSKPPVAKLSDFGGTLHKDDAPISFCGHRKFCSPQVLKQREQKIPIQYTFADDVYMFGMSLYEVASGYTEGRIWPSLTEVQVMKKIISGERPPMQSLNIFPAFKKLIEDCWNEDPNKRPTFSQIVKTLESIQKSKEKSLKIRKEHKETSAKGIDHTVHLYMFDEVMSVLQKSIRRGQIEDAMYWAAELDLSGKGKIALQRITVVCSEDVSLGVVSLPTYLRDQYMKYCGSRKADVKNSRKILLESAGAIASVIKCQVANHACGASLNYVQKSVEDKDPFYSQYLPKASEHWIEDLRKLMDQAKQSEFDLNIEKKILFLLQRLYMEGFEEATWKMIVKLQLSNPVTKSAIDALYDLTIPKHIGGNSGSRLRLFHAVLLYIREKYLDFSQTVPEIKVDDSIIDKYYTKMGLEGRNKEGIPDYAVDRHNKRGKGAGSDDIFHYGEDTRGALAKAADHWKVDISSWTEEEICKSHGPGRRMFKDITIGTPTLLTQFFDEGDLLDRETFVMPGKHTHDPFFFDARDFYTQWEIQYGSTEAKSEKMMQEQLKLLEKFAKPNQTVNKPNLQGNQNSNSRLNKNNNTNVLKEENFPPLNAVNQQQKAKPRQPGNFNFQYNKKMFGKKKRKLFKEFLNSAPEVQKKVENGEQAAKKIKKGEQVKKNKASSIDGMDLSKDVVIKKFEKKDQIPEIDPEHPLKTWIYPLTPNQFLDSFYKKKAFATVNAPIKRAKTIIEDFLFNLDIESLLSNTASDSIHVWMRSSFDSKIDSFQLDGDSAVKSALICYGSGASLYFRSPQEMAEVFVRNMSNDLGMNFAGIFPDGAVKGEIEVFVTRAGHVTDWHFDFMENFTIQLKGSKTWKLMRNNIPHPMRGCTPHYKNLDTTEQQVKVHRLHDQNFEFEPKNFENVEEVTLTPGSILYFPAGYWHRVECSEDSVSINISLVANNWADLVTGGIHQVLWGKEDWREGICFSNPQIAKQKLGNLLAKLKEDINHLTVDDFLPPSMFTPRVKSIDVENSTEISQVEIEKGSKFRKNSLAVLVKLESYESDDESEGDEEGWVEMDDDNSGEESPSKEIGGVKDRDFYAVHINFGNEELTSEVRIVLKIGKELSPALEWIWQRKEAFSVEEIIEQNNVDRERLLKLLRAVCFSGLIVVQ